MSEGEKEGSFKIVDKRRFTSDGQVRADAPPDEVRKPMVVGVPPKQQQPQRAPQAEPQKQAQPAQPERRPRQESKSGMDFISFIASLATNAMAAMGALPEAQARGMPVNPQLAREYIEIIAMLRDRTEGNLTREEDAALARLLNDLQLTFVEVQREAAAQASAARGGAPGLPGLPKR